MGQARFTPGWLALREPADLAARNTDVLRAVARRFRNRRHLTICDLGAGTGASVRALAGLLPERQSWILVDNDRRNLTTAKRLLTDWADEARVAGDRLDLVYRGRTIHIRTELRDLSAAHFEWPENTGLVTATALFDLTSRAWIRRLVRSIQDNALPLLATLTFNGSIDVKPGHPSDRAVAASFLAHMQRDKGFGPAAGAKAGAALETALLRAGYRIATGQSPWIMTRKSQALLDATITGIANAATQMGRPSASDIRKWRKDARSRTISCEIGHDDIFAEPPRSRRDSR